MSAAGRPFACLLALAVLSAPASAQVVSTAPLGQVDPWGVGWLGRADGALPTSLWANTSAETLQPLLAGIDGRALSPAGRTALRRVLFSGARGPGGDADLILERIRLMEQIGETRRAIDLRERFPAAEWGKPANRIASELDLASGRTQDGCARVAGTRADDADWMPLRALCLALAGDHDGAGLVSEQAGLGAWLISSIETIRGPVRTRPEGRYSTAFEAAVSIAAKLSAPADAFRKMAPDLAAAIVTHPEATLEQKRAALRPALEGGRLDPEDVLAVLTAIEETPAPAARRTGPARVDFVAIALEQAAKEDAAAGAQATAYAAAFKGADSAYEFQLAAHALIGALRKLPMNADTLPHAETFARAAIAMGDAGLAAGWRKLMDDRPQAQADKWTMARIDLMLALSGDGEDKDGALADALLDAVPAPVTARNPTPAQRQADLRRIENTRILFLYTATGRTLSPAARAHLSGQRTAGRGVPDGVLASIQSALEADAVGEGLVAAIAQLTGDPSAISFAGLSDLLTLLRRAGFEKEADAVFLEALQVWRTL